MSKVILTPEQQIRQRYAWFAEAARLGNVTVACRRCGISRKTFYKWRQRTHLGPARLRALLLSVTAFADKLEREKARQRSYDAMVRKARALPVTGGRVFGYDNVDVPGLGGSNGKRWHVVRRINQGEAAIVRRVFELCAAGKGFTSIAKTLNHDGALCPRPRGARPA